MKTKLYFLILLSCFSAAQSFADPADLALATSKNCLACHSVERKVVGPAFKDVASKYAGQKDAAEKLASKIQKGGGGVWGAIPMPANGQVSEVEARKLALWILGGAK